MTIDAWLNDTSNEFADAMLPSARLDAEIILAHTIGHPRTWLHAHGDDPLDSRRRDIADARAALRLERVPVAYIIGHKEFYGRRFAVSPDTLIPRPESEALIDLLKVHIPDNATQLVDVGTGSGCLGITAALEMPQLSVTLTDISKRALAIAEKNLNAHHAKARLVISDLLDQYPLRADVIVANLPYVDRSWTVSAETDAEPEEALYADNDGLALIMRLLEQIPDHSTDNALIILEADLRQHQSIIDQAAAHGYVHLETRGLGVCFSRPGLVRP